MLKNTPTPPKKHKKQKQKNRKTNLKKQMENETTKKQTKNTITYSYELKNPFNQYTSHTYNNNTHLFFLVSNL
jgi:hypothetical protein